MFLTDLKIIDELLTDYKYHTKLSWKELEAYSNLTQYAMNRLRQAWISGEMKIIGMGLAEYFRTGNG